MTRRGRLWQELCGHRRADRQEEARTDELIDEAERTRRELARLTDRLAAHVIALKTLARVYAREQQGGTPGG